jgi:hypothetical protein
MSWNPFKKPKQGRWLPNNKLSYKTLDNLKYDENFYIWEGPVPPGGIPPNPYDTPEGQEIKRIIDAGIEAQNKLYEFQTEEMKNMRSAQNTQETRNVQAQKEENEKNLLLKEAMEKMKLKLIDQLRYPEGRNVELAKMNKNAQRSQSRMNLVEKIFGTGKGSGRDSLLNRYHSATSYATHGGRRKTQKSKKRKNRKQTAKHRR